MTQSRAGQVRAMSGAAPARASSPSLPLTAQHMRLTNRIGPSSHACVTFSFVISGRYRKITPTGPIALRAGHVTVADAGMVCAFEPEEPARLVNVFVAPALQIADASWMADVPRLRELVADGPAGRPVVLDIGMAAMRTLIPYLDALAASTLSAPMSSVARFVEILEEIALAEQARRAPDAGELPEHGRLIPLHMEPSLRHHPAVFEAIMCLAEGISRPWSAASLAAAVNLSEPQLRRQFLADVGMTPTAYLAELRLRRMAFLMRRSGVSVGEAAIACGFPNPNYASRRFHLRWGMPPQEYRSAFHAEHVSLPTHSVS